jgi:hypothetical protein
MVPPDLRNATITLSEFYQTLSFECFDARQELTQWGSAELTHAGNRIENGNAIQGIIVHDGEVRFGFPPSAP